MLGIELGIRRRNGGATDAMLQSLEWRASILKSLRMVEIECASTIELHFPLSW